MAIGIILFIVLAAVAIGCIIWAVNAEAVGRGIAIVLALLSIASLFIIPFSFHSVQSGEVAVVKEFGKVQDAEKTAGLHFDIWVTKTYTKYDATVQTLDLTFSAYSADAQTMQVAMTLQYQIIPDRASDIATHYGSLSTLENRITSISTEKTKSVLSSEKAMDIIANRAQMSPAVEEAVKAAIGDSYYVTVNTVVLTDITFTDAFELAVEEKMIAEQAKLKAEYENQTKVAQAEAEAAAKLKAAQAEIDIAQAQADAKLKQAEAQIKIAEAEAEAKLIAAVAESEANMIIAESITPEILEKMFMDTWNGELPKMMGSSDNVMLPGSFLE